MNNVLALKKTVVLPIARDVANALWFSIDQARAVAECISNKCDIGSENAEVLQAFERINALAGAVAKLLSTALDEVAVLEKMV
jgi:hypothetical protein